MENQVLEFWKDNKIFEATMRDDGRPAYSFYDGPPFATGLPHYGHVVASLIKDVVPRYWTMKGYRVDRRWGWDCHGLPVENLIEKELSIPNKQAIEDLGIDKFNEACCGSVLRYADEWKEFIPRVGRWVDMENDYKTMNWQYTESIWWVFSELYKKGLVYEGYKSMHMCPRCETTLANFEVTQGYKDITDLSATVKFKLTPESRDKLRDEILKQVQDEDTGLAESDVYILAWTTTPWTLPGNVALAMGNDIEYDLVNYGDARYILAKDKLSSLVYGFPDDKSKVVGEFKGSDLVGLSYEPLFAYYTNKEDLANRENGWKIYSGDFVTTEEGTGVVHIAPAFGEDDMNLAREKKLPFVQHVSRSGHFVEFIDSLPDADKTYFIDKDGKGREVKPKRNARETDEKVVEYLKKENILFASENYKHSYPHCWRCDTPLLNYASGSWFVEVTKLKDRLVKNNQEVNWVPGYIKEGRFGKWLEGAIDWAVSRSRFWGAALPIWKCEECGKLEVIGGIDELREKASHEKITKIIFTRHGQAECNVTHTCSGKGTHPLTEKGREQTQALAQTLKDTRIDIVISSPLVRAKETATILAGVLNLEVAEDERLREIDFGSWEGRTRKDLEENDRLYADYLKTPVGEEKYEFKYAGESRKEVESRVRAFIDDSNAKYPGKNILVVGHGIVGAMLHKLLEDLDMKDFFEAEKHIHYAQATTFYVRPDGKAFDLHKPYIDRVQFPCSCGGSMKLVGDVFDCWFESGSMPYAQIHYPFENKDKFEADFPAQFIAEGIDQTRGWFYTLMVLSTALFDKPAFKNVIVNGIVLAEDGQKMSKKLKNYPDPNLILSKYGADSLRYYLLTSPVIKAENLRFSEKGVDEVLKRFVLTLWNTYSFLVMNVELNKIKPEDIIAEKKSDNLLDRWILSELNLLIAEVDQEMQNYDLVKASRPLMDFVDKLSNWYLRRSRRRFTSEDTADKLAAYHTLHYVLLTFAKLMAPFMPFLAEEIYKNLSEGESVHLESFPVVTPEGVDDALMREMQLVREVVTLGLAARAKNRLKVRMPLAHLEIAKEGMVDLRVELMDILKDELNIKNVAIVKDIQERESWAVAEDGGIKVALDLTITEELELEGAAREVIRQIQSMRKSSSYERDERVSVLYELSENAPKLRKMFASWSEEIKGECLLMKLKEEKEVMKEEFDGVGELELSGEKMILIVKDSSKE
jgi:isoleucyl-tRNA synthetase